MCQFNGHRQQCRTTNRHLPGTVCPSTGRRAGRIPVAITALAVVIALALAVPALLNAKSDQHDTSSTTQRGTLAYVVDGDTIAVDLDGRERRVRLVGVDSPETDACYGKQATTWLTQRLPAGTDLDLVDDPSQPDTDQYDRLLRYVKVDHADVGLELLGAGQARPYDFGPAHDHPRRRDYAHAAARAKNDDRGLWLAC